MLNLLHPVKNSQLSAEGSFIRAIFDYLDRNILYFERSENVN
jgi:hypothetical protein